MLDNEPDVINDTSEDSPDSVSQVTIDLEKKPEVKADQPKPVEKTEAPKPQADLIRLNNTIAYQTRQLEKAMRELAEVKTQLAQRPQIVQDNSQTLEEIDEIAQKDWKKGVKKVVEKDIETKIQEILQQRDATQREINKKSSLEAELEKSKQKVLSKYPQIEDEASEESTLYRQVINEDASILSNIHGPEIAMYRMEERMRQMGKTPPSVRPIVDREVNRLTRAGAASVVGRQASPNGKITLTKEQKEFCDHYKIPYEQYAKNLKTEEVSGGVEI